MEIWKDIKGYEGHYKISNFGRVKNRREQIVRIYPTSKNYAQVSLCKNSIQKSYRLHRLVAFHFIENPNNLPQVNHIDGDKWNNTVENLEWCTNKENSIHSFKIGLQRRDGIYNPNTKLTDNDVLIIRKLRTEGESLKNIATLFNFSLAGICKICLNKTWKHVK